MTTMANRRHFMQGNTEAPDMPGEAKQLFRFLTAIIEAATIENDSPVAYSENVCRNVKKGNLCRGVIEVWGCDEGNQIGWECTECGDNGMIADWQATPWDKRNKMVTAQIACYFTQ